MGKTKYIETPEKTWEYPYKKDSFGNYIIIPKRRVHSGITTVNKRKFPNGYIYFIKIKNQNLYKLGVSQEPQRRLKDIDSYLPFEFEILSLHYFNEVYDIEELISNQIKYKNVKKEWYLLDIEEAKLIMVELYNLNLKQDASTKRK